MTRQIFFAAAATLWLASPTPCLPQNRAPTVGEQIPATPLAGDGWQQSSPPSQETIRLETYLQDLFDSSRIEVVSKDVNSPVWNFTVDDKDGRRQDHGSITKRDTNGKSSYQFELTAIILDSYDIDARLEKASKEKHKPVTKGSSPRRSK